MSTQTKKKKDKGECGTIPEAALLVKAQHTDKSTVQSNLAGDERLYFQIHYFLDLAQVGNKSILDIIHIAYFLHTYPQNHHTSSNPSNVDMQREIEVSVFEGTGTLTRLLQDRLQQS